MQLKTFKDSDIMKKYEQNIVDMFFPLISILLQIY